MINNLIVSFIEPPTIPITLNNICSLKIIIELNDISFFFLKILKFYIYQNNYIFVYIVTQDISN